ncbi:MAG: transglutaminase-like domain-containing protein [Myxococcota bacterium]
MISNVSSAREFTFGYNLTLRAADTPARIWVPIPSSDRYQNIIERSFEFSRSGRVQLSTHGGNRILFIEVPLSNTDQKVALSFQVSRLQRLNDLPPRDPYPASLAEMGVAQFLAADSRVPTDGAFGEEARAIVQGKHLPVDKARAVFEHILQTYAYDSSGCTPEKGDALGDLQVACDLKLGTCTELHGLLVAYLRAAGVPARFAFGFNVPPRARGQIAGYHCWAEAYLPHSGWFPIDVSEARKRAAGAERDFYFGNLDENRVQFSVGRDVVLSPAQSSGPVDKFIFPHVEVEDRVVTPELSFSFEDAEQPVARAG